MHLVYTITILGIPRFQWYDQNICLYYMGANNGQSLLPGHVMFRIFKTIQANQNDKSGNFRGRGCYYLKTYVRVSMITPGFSGDHWKLFILPWHSH